MINKNLNITANISAIGANEVTSKYFNFFGKMPNLISIQANLNTKKVSKFLNKKGFDNNVHKYLNSFKDKKSYNVYSYLSKDDETYIVLDDAYLYILYSSMEPKSYIKELSQKKFRSKETHDKELCIIVPDQGSYRTNHYTLKRTDLVLENYNEDFAEVHNSIMETLNEEKSGLHLFYGIPGTGKSSYIASLTQTINKKFIYLPSSLFSALDSPVLMKLFLDNKNSIFIIEDGEKLLVNRENENNSPISSLLNMSDGLIGQLLNSQIICTFNTSLENIDKALMRNGRLLNMYEFKPLETQRAINLAIRINKPHEHINKPTILADIYNTPNTNVIEIKEIKLKRKAIGFQK